MSSVLMSYWLHLPSSMIELCPEPPPPEGPDPALAGNMGDTSSGSYPVMCSSTFWMNVCCAEPEDEEETAAGADDDDACGAAAAQRMVVGSLAVVEVESLGAKRDRLVGEMGPLRLRPCPVPPGYVKSWKTRDAAWENGALAADCKRQVWLVATQLTEKMKGSQKSRVRGWM